MGLLAVALGAFALSACPHDASLGTVTFVRGGAEHAVSLADCKDRTIGKPKPERSRSLRSRDGRVADIRVRRKPKAPFGSQTITVDGRAVYTIREDYRSVPAGEPGPLGLVDWSPDGRWVFFYVDPMGSASLAADGLELQAVRATGGPPVPVAETLMYRESPRWSRDGRALLFVRERQGRGQLMLWRNGRVAGPIANLGYSLGYYGHHDWPLSWTAGA